MKKLIAVLLTLSLAFSLAAATAEKTEVGEKVSKSLDLTAFETNSEYYKITANDESDSVFIETTASAQDRSFTTPYDSDKYYSAIFPELMITDRSKEGETENFFRIWVRFRGTRHINIQSISIIQDGTDYRFTDVTSKDWTDTKEDGTAAQDAVIILGSDPNNAACFANLLAKAINYSQAVAQDPGAAVPEIKMVLHGDEDIEIALSANFISEVALFALTLSEINGLSSLVSSTGTPCFPTQVK